MEGLYLNLIALEWACFNINSNMTSCAETSFSSMRTHLSDNNRTAVSSCVHIVLFFFCYLFLFIYYFIYFCFVILALLFIFILRTYLEKNPMVRTAGC